MKIKNLKGKLFYLTTIGLSMFLLFFVITSNWIGCEVKSFCQKAQRQYEGDCITAAAALLDDSKQPFGERNDAIWTLGQLGDKRALQILKQYYTGNMPDREPWYEVISQYELEKAINLISGGLNISAFMWRSLNL